MEKESARLQKDMESENAANRSLRSQVRALIHENEHLQERVEELEELLELRVGTVGSASSPGDIEVLASPLLLRSTRPVTRPELRTPSAPLDLGKIILVGVLIPHIESERTLLHPVRVPISRTQHETTTRDQTTRLCNPGKVQLSAVYLPFTIMENTGTPNHGLSLVLDSRNRTQLVWTTLPPSSSYWQRRRRGSGQGLTQVFVGLRERNASKQAHPRSVPQGRQQRDEGGRRDDPGQWAFSRRAGPWRRRGQTVRYGKPIVASATVTTHSPMRGSFPLDIDVPSHSATPVGASFDPEFFHNLRITSFDPHTQGSPISICCFGWGECSGQASLEHSFAKSCGAAACARTSAFGAASLPSMRRHRFAYPK
ncbi:hypothetical protein FA13DRAFT_1722644 [Coprinellus micaceus]|uniref:Uncharacterized protein n=1 Tax=Coprinellus micaceus TaxID=71717 RepID=A0A4Y7RJU9_COPMI|nr:hypothetical protein FA13DRAFT_1722644 [Coprinellus micaceus]